MKLTKAHANCLRFLAVDAIDKAQSGHPGMPLGMADVMTVLYLDFLKHQPQNPQWEDRDRVVLSNGHGSMLLYAALHLTGYAITIDDIKNFRQIGSICAGHPEYEIEKGVEVTTGPLGQGIAMAIGMAIGIKRRKHMRLQSQSHVFCFVGDGCLMEGISHEASSLAPHLLDSGLILLWDDNGISIDGSVDGWMEYDVCQRYRSYGFKVITDVDAHDFAAIRMALSQAKKSNQPVLIQFKSTIGKGCKFVEGQAKAHGQPLKKEYIQAMREALDWPYQPFEIPHELAQDWLKKDTNEIRQPAVQEQIKLDLSLLTKLNQDLSTRQASSIVINQCLKHIPQMFGGSADLAASTLTNFSEEGYFTKDQPQHRNIAYGVREFAMFAIANGIALTQLIPFVSTFLVFLDYGKNALRLAALMRLRVIYILTHDSVFLGEDGPTHQPVEQIATCRAMPNVELWRPCGLFETAIAWEQALENTSKPSVLALSRQKMPKMDVADFALIRRGYYDLIRDKQATHALIATGSEVALALSLAQRLQSKDGIICNVISVPCYDRFIESDIDTFLEIKADKRMVIEASSPMPWYRVVSNPKQIIGISEFGLSAKPGDIAKHFSMDQDGLYQVFQMVFSE
ncbi:transketolase [Gammaproteobacteria bacterium]|nr:transketolase [Gammaproteobacteria bacterium]